MSSLKQITHKTIELIRVNKLAIFTSKKDSKKGYYMNSKCVNYHFHQIIIDFFVRASRLNFLIETEDSEVVYFINFKVHKVIIVQYQYASISHRCIYIYKHLTSVFIKRLTDGSIYSFYLCSLQKQSFQTMHSVKRSL